MITMSDLSEASILWNIKVRYDHRQFYTYIGSILVAVNPYHMYHDMYSTTYVRKYENALVMNSLPAHIFATASLAHNKMLTDKMNQCVLISGESGGGKTQSTKLIMNYLATVNPGKNKLITEQILEASPLLESFGNAKTVRNDNSSRFGKYIEIYYSQKSIVGAKLSDFLLEKSRIVTHSTDERNYHVFYELLEGFDNEEKRKYGLTTPEKYFYLNQGASMAISSKSDANDFQSLLTAMKILNFTKNEQETIFKILAAILHLGNIYFSRNIEDPSHDLIQISSKTEIEWCSHLLGLNDQGLLQNLTHKVTEARDERLLSPFNLEQALDSRDAIAKALYSTLFSWLVARINQIVRVNNTVDNSIAILDIFGFENFSINSFEQLCINYANEALQFHFNRHVFKLEQEEYAKEKLAWKKIDFADNTDCLDLIGKKPNGILQILDDESNFPKATDHSFLHKCHRLHESNRLYGKPRLLKTTFSIRHYAGEVEYDVRGFLDKNRDLLRGDVIDLFSSSRNEILANMFRDIRDVYESHRGFHFKTGRFITMKAKTPTVSAKFSDSLSHLIETMTRCQPTFIRCIKPNNDKTPNKLELSVVLEQLRNTGMLETVRIRKLGFPRRYSFEQFATRYRCLIPNSPGNIDVKETTVHILNNLSAKFTLKYQIGITKIFLRESLEYHLEKERSLVINKAASTIQRAIKSYIQRKQFEKQRRAVVLLQKQYRRWLDNKKQTTTTTSQDYQFNLLEIPNELDLVFRRLDAWEEPHSDEHIIETSRSTHVIPSEQLSLPPNNTEKSSFLKYIQEHTYLGNKWDRLLTPIEVPLTNNISNQQQTQLALSLFKLILRFVNTSEHEAKRDRALGDYIVQIGLMNEILRDEILIQILNQIWNNMDLIRLHKAWLLMLNCISCFSPSSKLYKHLYQFIFEENPANSDLAKRKLLAAGGADAPRTYPPTQLEWAANKRSSPMALQAEFSDHFEAIGEVESWMTGEQYAYELVSSRGIIKDYCSGWTVSLEEDGNEIELMGHDYILDLIGELEIPPCAPVCKSFFLIHDGRDRSSKTPRRRNYRTTVRSKEWYLKVDNSRSSRLSKASRQTSSSNHSSPYKYPRRFSSDEQQQSIEKKYTKRHSPVYHDVPMTSNKSDFSESSSELSDVHTLFPPPPASATKDLLKTDATSAYSMTDDLPAEIPIRKSELNVPSHPKTPPLPPVRSSTRSSREPIKKDEKSIEKRKQSSTNKTILKPTPPLPVIEPSESIRKANTFTSSSHSMIDAGCSGHILSKIPALRCFRPNKQHHTQKFHKTSPLPPPPLVVSDYSGPENANSFYGEFSVCSDAPTNLNQYEKIGSSIHHTAKLNGHPDDYHLSSTYSDGGIVGDMTEYEAEEIPIKKSASHSKDISRPGTKFIKNKNTKPKSGYPQAKKQGNSIFDSESIATITDLPLPCHKSDVEAFLDDLFERALDPKNLAKKKNKTALLSTIDQRRLQMISNSRMDQSTRRRGLTNFLHKTQSHKKSSIRSAPRAISAQDQTHHKKKSKIDKDLSERKKRTKSKKKRYENSNINNNNNNNALMTEQSFMSFTSENSLMLPQIGYSSRADMSDTSEYARYARGPKHDVFYRQPSGTRRCDVICTYDSDDADCSSDKKNIKLIPINPDVCFATTTSTINSSKQSITSSSPAKSNGPVFVPVIDISGKKYLPVYLKQSNETDNSANQLDKMPLRLNNTISQLVSSNPILSSKKTPTIIEENEIEPTSMPSSPVLSKPNLCVERLSISQLDTQFQQGSKDYPVTNNHKHAIKVPSHILTRRSPEFQKNLRAKTVRIGKIRWPPPLNAEEIDSANQHRRLLVQRRIQEEIHGAKPTPSEPDQTNNFNNINHDPPPILPDQHQRPLSSTHYVKGVNIEQKVPTDRRVQSDEKLLSPSTNDPQKKSPVTKTLLDLISPLSDAVSDDDMSTNEIVARNHSSRLDFHKTLTPMIGKENFELRKKLFEHPDESSLADTITIPNDIPNTSKHSSRQLQHFLMYHNITWILKLRKEVFSPAETFDQPILIELLYLQIVRDTFSSICIRISEAERTNMKTYLSSHGVVVVGDIDLINKLSAKKSVIEQARQWPTYFCRFFPVSMPKYHSGEVQMLGVSHSGVRLIKRNRSKTASDTLQVLETFLLDSIQQTSSIRNGSTIDLRLTKKRITIHSHRIQIIKQIIDKFLKESRLGHGKHSRTSNHKKTSQENFSPNLISTTSDLFKSSSQASLLSCSQTFSELIPSASFDAHTPKPTKTDLVSPTISALPNGHSMMEFALQNFKLQNKRRSKKSWKNSEWTWQEYSELLKWSKNPIHSPLLQHSSNDCIRIARQCFLAIMRFMGDHPMSRGQTDIDCLLYILKSMHKHRTLIDEILCQLIKQLTENKSTKNDSVQYGWKLLVIILNYFTPSPHLRPYFVKYLNDNINQNEKLVQLCLNHYDQTLKYGGRKNTPSKAEIDLLTANGRNGGKRQTFLLPGGNPLTLLTTPSMVIDDCLNLICERFNITNSLEHDEYSIFIISPSDQSSRLLNPTEYLFDVLSECVRSNMVDYHLIMKRMLWYTIPMTFDDNNKSEMFVDFMYHQLIPELLEGTIIVIKNNHLSDELMQSISLMAALQYRASNKIGLPSMREVKHLLPATVLKLKSVRPQVWTTTVHEKLYSSVETMTINEAKMKLLDIIQTWPLFGMTFFAVQSVDDPSIRSPCLIGIYKNGILFLDIDTRETLFSISYNDVVSIRRHQNSIDIKYGSLNQPRILQCQVERAQDLVALAGRYLSFVGRSLSTAMERKSENQTHLHSSISAYHDPISTIL
ncbi:unnamed protein product [Adineta ricciae]|uniref:Unconventional myosin-XV n=1 Tax=Adineta ricciae TaxID=249248 RepID=A0A814ZA67_ADIRI|nr:unnamed protein product [Adineta ricciae]